MSQPEVSVVLVTYNHEPFITQAVESVLAQRTDFPCEIIISEDCSTDRTRDLVRALQERHPDRIRLVLSETNQNDNAVVSRAAELARGRFVAVLDGDDYWTSPEKLQRQRDHLLAHPDQSACFHNVLVAREDGHLPPAPYNPDDQPAALSGKDLWRGNPIATCSVMFRRHVFDELPAWYRTARWGDWPLYLLSADHGPIGYLPEVMGVYRVHSGGYWSRLTEVERHTQIMAFLREMNVLLGERYAPQAQAGIARCQMRLYAAYRASGNRAQAWRIMAASLRENMRSEHMSTFRLARMALGAALPQIHRRLTGGLSVRSAFRRVIGRNSQRVS